MLACLLPSGCLRTVRRCVCWVGVLFLLFGDGKGEDILLSELSYGSLSLQSQLGCLQEACWGGIALALQIIPPGLLSALSLA